MSNSFMENAFAEAELAAKRGEVPVGAVLVTAEGTILAKSGNRTEELADPTAHAEMLVIRAACVKRGEPRLPDCDLYVTLEPCALCAAAISFSRLRRVVFAAYDPRAARLIMARAFSHSPPVIMRPKSSAEWMNSAVGIF